MRARAERVRRHVAADRRHRRRVGRRDVIRGFDRRILERHELRDPLLQQQLGRLDARIGVKAVLHRRAVQQVVERDQAHALVVRHVGRQGMPPTRVLGQPFGRVVDRLVVAVAPGESFRAQPLQIADDVGRRERRRENGGVRRDDEILGQPALQAEAGHAERAVLIVPVEVLHVVGGLRDAPRHAALIAVLDLPLDHGFVRLVEQRARIGAHHEQRHQVLEHRRAPRQQRARRAARRQRASELEPVLVRDLARGDRHEARQSRLRRQHVVVRAVEPTVGDAVADREELPVRVEEEAELDFFEEIVGERRQPLGALDRFFGVPSRALDRSAHVVAGHSGDEPLNAALAHRTQSRKARHEAGSLCRALGVEARRPTGQALELRLPIGDGRAGPLEPIRGIAGSWRRIGRQRLLDFVQRHAERVEPVAQTRQQRLPGGKRHRPAREIGANRVELLAQPAAMAPRPTPSSSLSNSLNASPMPSSVERSRSELIPRSARVRIAASADTRRDCRCRPWRCTPAPAARASSCRTS